jgi:hypothetical protein
MSTKRMKREGIAEDFVSYPVTFWVLPAPQDGGADAKHSRASTC